MKQYVLLNPGPACTTQSVKDAMLSVGDVCPREIETGNLMEKTSEIIIDMIANGSDDYEAILLASSGTGAVEMVVSSLPVDANVLNIVNGAYGERIQEMLNVYSIANQTLDFNEYLIDYKLVEHTLSKGCFTHITIIHCETTTGVINDIKKIAYLGKKYGCKIVVDAMSSAFAYPINVKESNIAFMCASSNKLVQGIAGLGIVIANKTELEKCHRRTVYLDLREQAEYFGKTRQMRFTPPVQVVNALHQALIELKNESIEKRYLRYAEMNQYIRSEMESLGFSAYIPREHNSIVITSFFEPAGFNFHKFHFFLKEQGFVIYPGKVSKNKTFRLSNIGHIDMETVKKFILAVKIYIKSSINLQ